MVLGETNGLLGLQRANHHLGDEVDNSTGWLFRVVLCKQVADVLCAATTLSRYEAKDPVFTQQNTHICEGKLLLSLVTMSYWYII